MRTWKNVELTRERYEKLRRYLKENGIAYEPSGVGKLIHVELLVNDAETAEVNNYLEVI